MQAPRASTHCQSLLQVFAQLLGQRLVQLACIQLQQQAMPVVRVETLQQVQCAALQRCLASTCCGRPEIARVEIATSSSRPYLTLKSIYGSCRQQRIVQRRATAKVNPAAGTDGPHTAGCCPVPQTWSMGGDEGRCPSQSMDRAALSNWLRTVRQMLPGSEAEVRCCMVLLTISLSKGLAAGGHQAAVVCTPAAGTQGTHQQKHAAQHAGCESKYFVT